MSESSSVRSHRLLVILSYILSVVASYHYQLGNGHVPKHVFDAGHTPFSASRLFIFIYWVVAYIGQLFYISQLDAEQSIFGDRKVLSIGSHFIVFNILHFVWQILFHANHRFLSEIVVIINFFNLLSCYVSHKTYSITPISKFLRVHVPAVAFPLSWTLYAIFWNGATAFHVHHLLGRVLANILIWDFLLVPLAFVFFYRDWSVGLTSAFLTLGLAFGQLGEKVIALQWIFAFIIAAIVAFISLLAAIPSIGQKIHYTVDSESQHVGSSEQAPLLHN